MPKTHRAGRSGAAPSTRAEQWRTLPRAGRTEDDMAFEGLLETGQDRRAHCLLEEAAAGPARRRIGTPAHLPAEMFARAAPEDLTRYAPLELAALAEEAWQFLQHRIGGTAEVRMRSPIGPSASERLRTISILEVVNDNMPFLLDSIMGELSEQGLEVRLVAHP